MFELLKRCLRRIASLWKQIIDKKTERLMMTPITESDFDAIENTISRAWRGEYHQAASPTFFKYTISAQQLLRMKVFPNLAHQ